MSNDNVWGAGDETESSRLVSLLRQEIAALEQEVETAADDDDVDLPDGIELLLRRASVPAKIASAVDDVVADIAPISDEFARSLRAAVEQAQADRGIELAFLERRLTHLRVHVMHLDVDAVARAIGATSEIVTGIETGVQPFDALEEIQVNKWIRFLDTDLEGAVAALERSVRSPAHSYAGDPDDYNRRASAFVDEVRRLLFLPEVE